MSLGIEQEVGQIVDEVRNYRTSQERLGRVLSALEATSYHFRIPRGRERIITLMEGPNRNGELAPYLNPHCPSLGSPQNEQVVAAIGSLLAGLTSTHLRRFSLNGGGNLRSFVCQFNEDIAGTPLPEIELSRYLYLANQNRVEHPTIVSDEFQSIKNAQRRSASQMELFYGSFDKFSKITDVQHFLGYYFGPNVRLVLGQILSQGQLLEKSLVALTNPNPVDQAKHGQTSCLTPQEKAIFSFYKDDCFRGDSFRQRHQIPTKTTIEHYLNPKPTPEVEFALYLYKNRKITDNFS